MRRNFAIIIPARYQSSRLPGKPLLDIGGKSLIKRTYLQALQVTGEVYVATDDERIFDHVRSFGNAVLTSESHSSGTDRVREAVEMLKTEKEYVINVQGDEPFIKPEQIDELAEMLDGSVEIASLAKRFSGNENVSDPNAVKVVLDKKSQALYFSRSPIPYFRNVDKELNKSYLKHIGIYAYRMDILKKITELEQTDLEKTESLEQLRWLENGFKIKMGLTSYEVNGIDTKEDLEFARNLISGKEID